MTLKSLALVGMMLSASPWLESHVASSTRAIQTVPSASAAPSYWRIRLTLRAGQAREATLDGVGCSQLLCSRTGIRARAERQGGESPIRFHDIRAIRLSVAGHATVETIDGASRDVVIPVENRVLYLIEAGHTSERLDIGQLTAIEFLR